MSATIRNRFSQNPLATTTSYQIGNMVIDEKDFYSFIFTKQSLSEGSIRTCKSRLRIVNLWFSGRELNKQNVEKFFMDLKTRGRNNNTLNTYGFLFRQLVAYCKDRGLPADFFDGFKSFKKVKPDIIIFTKDEIEKILSTSLSYGSFRGMNCSILDFRFRAMTMFLAYTGCRYSEASELRVKHVDISAGKAIFVNTKTNQNRTAYFIEPLKSKLEILIRKRKPDDRVFTNMMGKQVQVTDFSSDLKRRAVTAGVTKRTFPHNFRHSYITHMLEAGVPITEVAPLVGHKDIQTTYSTYMHLADKTLERAAMRHPMVRLNVDPKEVIKSLKETVDNLHLENDQRFSFSISEKDGSLSFSLSLK
ncbi:MAG: tyrosine-type recombinase/integrase [Patescibacteria group bacterium]